MTSNQEDLIPIYSSMIGGSIPLSEKADPDHSVSLIAEDIFGTASIHKFCTVQNGYAFYLAVPSRILSSLPDFATPLAACLPGGQRDQGDGIYFMQLLAYSAAVVRKGQTLRLIFGFTPEVRDSTKDEGLDTFDIDFDSSGEGLRSESWYYRSLANKSGFIASASSVATLAICAVLFIGAKVVSGYYEGRNFASPEAVALEAERLVKSAQFSNPMGSEIERLLNLSSTVVRSGGWIEGYQFDQTNGERFVLTLPSWTSQETIKQLGPKVTTEESPDGLSVMAYKTDKHGRLIAGMGPKLLSEIDKSALAKIDAPRASQGSALPLPAATGNNPIKESQ